MALELWLIFALASAILLAVPGPTIILVISYALGRGRGSGFATVPGVVLGDFTAMTVSLLGAGAVLAASATLFTILKLCGAAYLVWLGIRLWRAEPGLAPLAKGRAGGGASGLFWNAYAVTALNPKSLVFFIAFVPQFVVPGEPLLAQFAILEATFLVLAAVNAMLWIAFIGEIRTRLRHSRLFRGLNRIGGSFLIGAGVVTAAVRRTG